MSTILEQLLKELQGMKHTTPSGNPTSPMLHGPGGIFSGSGIDREIISTRVIPMGLASELPAYGSVYTHPLFQYVTGFTGPTGSQPTDACGDGPTVGAIKSCLQTAQFGRVVFNTPELDINRVGQLVDNSERLDLQFVNDPFISGMVNGIFADLDQYERGLLASEVASRFALVASAFQDELSKKLYTGTGAEYDFPGLELLVTEDHFDARTGASCPSLASDIRDFGNENVNTVDGAANIFNALLSMYRNLSYNARTMNFGVVDWRLVMREDLFNSLADIWPCQYVTSGCLPNNSNVSINVEASGQIQLRDDIRANKYLLIDAKRIPVVTDPAIVESVVSDGVYASDIWFLPFTVRNGQRPVLYWEYFDYSKGTIPAIREGRSTSDFWSDSGRYLWHKKPSLNWCTQWIGKVEPRVILRTPHLAGRLIDVAYQPTRHLRDAYNTGLSYLNGGVSTGYTAPSYYTNWS